MPPPQAKPVELNKPYYSTGEAARLSNLSQQTIIRSFDGGRLTGFRTPSSGQFRRIHVDSLRAFLQSLNIEVAGGGADAAA